MLSRIQADLNSFLLFAADCSATNPIPPKINIGFNDIESRALNIPVGNLCSNALYHVSAPVTLVR